MKSLTEIQNGLAHCYGSDSYTRLSPLHGKLVCTEGVVFLAESAAAFWLIDLIASHQPKLQKDESFREYQFWTIKCEPAPTGKMRKATVRCERDTGDKNALVQEIECTDFPLDTFKLFVEPGYVGGQAVYVCLLPSEH